MARVVLAIVVIGVLAACGAKRTSSEANSACPGYPPGPVTVTSCP